jgi:hypothetical protein
LTQIHNPSHQTKKQNLFVPFIRAGFLAEKEKCSIRKKLTFYLFWLIIFSNLRVLAMKFAFNCPFSDSGLITSAGFAGRSFFISGVFENKMGQVNGR